MKGYYKEAELQFVRDMIQTEKQKRELLAEDQNKLYQNLAQSIQGIES